MRGDVVRRHELKPYKVARPVKMELTFSDI